MTGRMKLSKMSYLRCSKTWSYRWRKNNLIRFFHPLISITVEVFQFLKSKLISKKLSAKKLLTLFMSRSQFKDFKRLRGKNHKLWITGLTRSWRVSTKQASWWPGLKSWQLRTLLCKNDLSILHWWLKISNKTVLLRSSNILILLKVMRT